MRPCSPCNPRSTSGDDVGNSICKFTQWKCDTADSLPVTSNSTGLVALRRTPSYELKQRLDLIRIEWRRVSKHGALSSPRKQKTQGPRPGTLRMSLVSRRRNRLADELAASTSEHIVRCPLASEPGLPTDADPNVQAVHLALLFFVCLFF